MKVVLRDPPLLVLLTAIVLDLPVRRVSTQPQLSRKPQGWASERLARFIQWRDGLVRRAT